MYFWQAHDFPENQSRGSYYAESHRQQAVHSKDLRTAQLVNLLPGLQQ